MDRSRIKQAIFIILSFVAVLCIGFGIYRVWNSFIEFDESMLREKDNQYYSLIRSNDINIENSLDSFVREAETLFARPRLEQLRKEWSDSNHTDTTELKAYFRENPLINNPMYEDFFMMYKDKIQVSASGRTKYKFLSGINSKGFRICTDNKGNYYLAYEYSATKNIDYEALIDLEDLFENAGGLSSEGDLMLLDNSSTLVLYRTDDKIVVAPVDDEADENTAKRIACITDCQEKGVSDGVSLELTKTRIIEPDAGVFPVVGDGAEDGESDTADATDAGDGESDTAGEVTDAAEIGEADNADDADATNDDADETADEANETADEATANATETDDATDEATDTAATAQTTNQEATPALAETEEVVYTARMITIPSEESVNGEFAIGITADYEEAVGPSRRAAENILIYGGIGVGGIVVLILLMLLMRRENTANARELQLLKRKNSEMEELNQNMLALSHHQRLETIGTMTASIAHDFNNLLTPIMGYSMMSMEMLPPGMEDIQENLMEVYNASVKAKDMVTRLAELTKKGKEENFTALDPAEIIDNSLKVTVPAKPKNVAVKVRFRSNNRKMRGDATQISQLVMNIVLNAYDAMREKGGTLYVSTRIEDNRIAMIFKDTGDGMDAETVARIFDPFYTTKESGKGTGLGLAIVAQIAETHGGKVYVDSTPGDGTEFKITFPMLEKEAEVNKSTIQINAEELKAKLDEASRQAQNK